MELFLTHACNLACGYCYNGRHFRRAMPREVMVAAIDLAFARGTGPLQVGFFGGEPLIEQGLVREGVRLCREASARTGRQVRFQMTTNGTLLCGDRLDFVAAEGFRVAVSLDGPADVHDRARPYAGGRGSHARVVRNIVAARGRVRSLSVACVLGPASLDRAREVVEQGPSLGVRTVHLSLDYHAHWRRADLARLPGALGAVGDAWVDAYRRGEPIALPLLDAKVARHVLAPLVAFGRCACGDAEWTVAPSGRIYPCDRLVGEDDGTEAVIGDVRNGIDDAAQARFLACHRGTPPRCAKCRDVSRCLFWASCVRHALDGRVDGEPSPFLCRLERAVIAAADRAATTLFEERNEAFLDRFYRGPLARRALEGLGVKPETITTIASES